MNLSLRKGSFLHLGQEVGGIITSIGRIQDCKSPWVLCHALIQMLMSVRVVCLFSKCLCHPRIPDAALSQLPNHCRKTEVQTSLTKVFLLAYFRHVLIAYSRHS